MKRIGIYGGSFDPVHFGHINLALEIAEAHQLDQVWFVPAYVSPHKQGSPPAAAEHRLQMLRLALEEIPQFRVLEKEIQQSGPSYTIDTVRFLVDEAREKALPERLYLILGEDVAAGFLQWRHPEEIIRLVPLLIGGRTLSTLQPIFPRCPPEIAKVIQEGFTQVRVLEISSTEIRRRVRAGLYCRHLVPSKVVDYIYEHCIY